MRYAIQTLWHDRLRYVPGILAVASSAVLIVCGIGILTGLLATVSAAVDHSSADIWVTSKDTKSCDTAIPISTHLVSRLRMLPEVDQVQECFLSMGFWKKKTRKEQPEGQRSQEDASANGDTPRGPTEEQHGGWVYLVGCNLTGNPLGPVQELSDDERRALAEVGAIIVPEFPDEKAI